MGMRGVEALAQRGMRGGGVAVGLAKVPPKLRPCSRFPPLSLTSTRACRSLTSRS